MPPPDELEYLPETGPRGETVGESRVPRTGIAEAIARALVVAMDGKYRARRGRLASIKKRHESGD